MDESRMKHMEELQDELTGRDEGCDQADMTEQQGDKRRKVKRRTNMDDSQEPCEQEEEDGKMQSGWKSHTRHRTSASIMGMKEGSVQHIGSVQWQSMDP